MHDYNEMMIITLMIFFYFFYFLDKIIKRTLRMKKVSGKTVINESFKGSAKNVKQYAGRYCEFCFEWFTSSASMGKHMHNKHQNEFKNCKKKYLSIVVEIAHPDLQRGLASMRHVTVGLNDFQIFLDPQFKVKKNSKTQYLIKINRFIFYM